MAILVTGGAGYIGSHTLVELIKKGYETVVIDNLYNSSEKSLDRVEAITGVKPKFYFGDVRDEDLLRRIFTENEIEYVIHFAGLKAVGESCKKPLFYYDNNLNGTLFVCNGIRYAREASSRRNLQNRRNDESLRDEQVFSGDNAYGYL